MTKFKVGDKVRYIGDAITTGATGEVMSVDQAGPGGETFITVMLNSKEGQEVRLNTGFIYPDGYNVYLPAEDLELITKKRKTSVKKAALKEMLVRVSVVQLEMEALANQLKEMLN